MNSIKSSVFITLICIFLESCLGGGNSREAVKFNQYMVQGMQLYRQHCANCHQVDGTGLANVIPPLKDSDYLKSTDPKDLACQVRYGISNEIMVNGKNFNQPMPGIPQLTALEIAEIVTYVDNVWGNESGLYGVKQTERALNDCLASD